MCLCDVETCWTTCPIAELNFKLIMCHCGRTCSRTGNCHRANNQPPIEIDTPTGTFSCSLSSCTPSLAPLFAQSLIHSLSHAHSHSLHTHYQPTQSLTLFTFSLDELRILFLQEEAGKLRQALAAERSKNARLLQLLQHRLELHKRYATLLGS